jgi:uncharacterized protein (DUF983 family)
MKGRVAAMSALTLSSLTSLFSAPPRRDGPVTSIEAVTRGLRGRCPSCGRGHMFSRFLKVADRCPVCGEELFHHRADDFPAYLVIVLVGHTVVPLALLVETEFAPALWLQVALWVPLTGLLSLALLSPVKGAVVAMQWFGGMHGFARAYAKRHDGDNLLRTSS